MLQKGRIPMRFLQAKKNSKCKQMEVFHESLQYTPSNLSDFIEFSLLLQSMSQYFAAEFIDRYMHCIMKNFKISAQDCIFFSSR